MRIQTSEVAMQSAYAYTSVSRESANLQMWSGLPPDQRTENQPSRPQPRKLDDWVDLSSQGKQLGKANKSDKISEDANLPPKLAEMKRAIESMIAWLSGRTVKLDLFSDEDLQPKNQSTPTPIAPSKTPSENTAPADWGMIFQAKSQYFEAESLNVGMAGNVTTADGRQISFNLSLQLDRQYYSENQVEMRAGNALTDPLVVNYGGQPAKLGVESVDFDLTPDEQMEKLPILNPNSGYLALDRNNNNNIDDGSELFGPQSGNGFAELQLLDDDGNGWIDEGDTAFAKLAIWQPNADGSSSLVGIGSLGIGAIYTGAVDAKFDYKNSNNELQGRMQRAGMFLFEDGRAGSMQQIDLAD